MLFTRMLRDKVRTKKEAVAWSGMSIIDVKYPIKMRGGDAFEMKAMVEITY